MNAKIVDSLNISTGNLMSPETNYVLAYNASTDRDVFLNRTSIYFYLEKIDEIGLKLLIENYILYTGSIAPCKWVVYDI